MSEQARDAASASPAGDSETNHHPRGTWFAPGQGRLVTQKDLLDSLSRKSVVLLGETHDNAEIHRWQLHVAAGLHARRGNMAIGFEMFPRRLQPVLDRWTDGALTTEQFLVEAEWFDVWGFDPEIYLPLFHFCRQQRVRMLALNCYRQLVTRVRHEGWAAIPEADRDGLTPSAPPREAYREYLAAILGSMPGRGGPMVMDGRFDGFVAAQQTWDRAFAVNIARALQAPEPPLVVGIIGRGHLEFGYGTPWQLRDLAVHDVAVLLTRTADDDPRKTLAPEIADAVFHIDEVEPRSPRPFKPGLKLRPQDGVAEIDSVADGSPAAHAGLQAGDRIRSIGGQSAASRAAAGAILRRLPPGVHLDVVVERSGTDVACVMHIAPPA